MRQQYVFFRVMALLLVISFCAGMSGTGAANASVIDEAESEVRATASVSSSRIFVGERFILTLEVTAPSMINVSRPDLPEIDGLRLLSPVPSRTNSFSLINGEAQTTSGFRFTLEAEYPGQITIPTITIEAGGRTLTTNAITLEVLSREQMQHHHTENEDVYLRLELSNDQPFAGEQVNAQVVLYFRNNMNVTSYQPAASWRTEGFWTERLTDSRGPRAETVIINGVQFRRAVLMNYALFPSRSGTVNLGAYRVNLNMRPTSRFGDSSRFFDGFGRSQRSVELQTAAQEITVRALPQPRPVGFTGAVGSFDVTRSVPVQEVIIGEPVEIETRFAGKGNVNLIGNPVYEIPRGFERFRPSEQADIRKTAEGIEGTKTFTDTWIARRTGSYKLPATRVYWFDPGARQYRYRELPEVQLTVLRDEDEEFLFVEDSRIRVSPATGLARWVNDDTGRTGIPVWYLLLGLLPGVVLLAGYFRHRYIERLRNDRAFSRSVHAHQKAEEKLKEADGYASNQAWKNGFRKLHSAVSGFICDKLNLPESGLSDAYLVSKVRENNADQALINRLERFLRHLSDIAYAPGEGGTGWEKDREEAKALIEALRKVLK